MRRGDQLVDNLLVAAMHAIEDAYRQPGVL
jgi:hypothetical protein